MRQLGRADSFIAIVAAATLTWVAFAPVASASRSSSTMRAPAAHRVAIASSRIAVPNKRYVPRRPAVTMNDTGVRPPRKPRRPIVNAENPERPGRPRRPGRPVLGPVVIGTGVPISTAAATPGPVGTSPPPGAFAPPGGPQGPGGPGPGGPGPGGPRNGIDIPPPNENRFVKNEVVVEFAGNFSAAAVVRLLARHRLVAIERQNFALTNTTYLRLRIPDRRSVRAVLNGLRGEATLRSGQPNYLFTASQQATAIDKLPRLQTPAAVVQEPKRPVNATSLAAPAVVNVATLPGKADPAQYAPAKLNLAEAHRIALGSNVLVAVIDAGIDTSHPELAGVIADTFDALGSADKPHRHGTAVAGAIAAHAKLLGVAPAARIIAIRAFDTKGNTSEATTFAILKGLDYAASHGAKVINMSFTGPYDPGLSRLLAAAHDKGEVLIAAAGNLGPKSPPQYPAADPNVIAVTATDADDNLFVAANRGSHIAVAAPGVDILLPAPGNAYWMASGTSFAAPHVSGIVALMLSRQPGLSPDAVKQILLTTAHDLGPPGRDPQFGAGLVDAYRAIVAVGLNAPLASGQ